MSMSRRTFMLLPVALSALPTKIAVTAVPPLATPRPQTPDLACMPPIAGAMPEPFAKFEADDSYDTAEMLDWT